jgi:hypothetical protein
MQLSVVLPHGPRLLGKIFAWTEDGERNVRELLNRLATGGGITLDTDTGFCAIPEHLLQRSWMQLRIWETEEEEVQP